MPVTDNAPTGRAAANQPSRSQYVPPHYPRPTNWMLISVVTVIVLAGIAFALLMWLTPAPA